MQNEFTDVSEHKIKKIEKHKNKYMRFLLAVAGSIFVVLGVIGLILPVMPGTIFLILATACFVRSSDTLYNWLVNHKWFGRFAKSYFEDRAMPMQAKIIASVTMWISVISSLFILHSIIIKTAFIITAIMVTIYFMTLKTMKK